MHVLSLQLPEEPGNVQFNLFISQQQSPHSETFWLKNILQGGVVTDFLSRHLRVLKVGVVNKVSV